VTVSTAEFKRLWSWGVLTDEQIAEGLRHLYGLEVEDGSHSFQVAHLGYEQGEPYKTLVPRERFSWGWPTYVEIEQRPTWSKYGVSWRSASGERMAARL
jgi:hypothetical protein